MTPSGDPALNPFWLSACCTDRMNDGSFVSAIALDEPPVELMLDDGMLELELAELPPPDEFDAVVLEPLPYVEDEEPMPVPELLPDVEGDDDAVVLEPLP